MSSGLDLTDRVAIFVYDLLAWVAVAIPALLGIAALALVARMYMKTRSYIKECVTTTGTVVRWEKREVMNPGESGGTVSRVFPVVRFQATSGAQVEFESEGGLPVDVYGKGEKVAVIYPPDRPQEATVRQFGQIWGGHLWVAGFGTFVLLFALLWLARKLGLTDRFAAVAIFGSGGIGVLVAAILIHRHASTFLKNAFATTGVVVQTTDFSGVWGAIAKINKGGPALIRFHAPSGAEIEIVAPARSDGPAYSVGEQVAILYDPARPGSARVEKPTRARRIAILMGIWGIALILFPLWIAFSG